MIDLRDIYNVKHIWTNLSEPKLNREHTRSKGFFILRRRKLIYTDRLLNDSDWWSIATVGALAFKRHVRVFLADEFVWIRNFSRGRRKRTPFDLLYRSISPVMVIAIMVNTMS